MQNSVSSSIFSFLCKQSKQVISKKRTLSEACIRYIVYLNVSEVFVFTRPKIIQSLSSSESGISVVHSGNQSTFSTALGWTE